VIELKHISKTFNTNLPSAVTALKDVSLLIPERSFIVVIGSNGSGKSTLLNILAGTVKPDEGTILIKGKDVTQLKDFQRSKWIARIFQNPLLGTSPELTVLENFRLAAIRTQPKRFVIGTGYKFRMLVQEKINILSLGLENKLDQPMGTLSGGQRQALTLLMAVMPGQMPDAKGDETRILLMDEPTAALDPKTSSLILELSEKIIKEFNLTVLFVTHHLKDALNYGNRIICMDGGKIIQDLSQESKSKLTIQEVYDWFESNQAHAKG
jgi:putative ABC transport system ATP-binding protein